MKPRRHSEPTDDSQATVSVRVARSASDDSLEYETTISVTDTRLAWRAVTAAPEPTPAPALTATPRPRPTTAPIPSPTLVPRATSVPTPGFPIPTPWPWARSIDDEEDGNWVVLGLTVGLGALAGGAGPGDDLSHGEEAAGSGVGGSSPLRRIPISTVGSAALSRPMSCGHWSCLVVVGGQVVVAVEGPQQFFVSFYTGGVSTLTRFS